MRLKAPFALVLLLTGAATAGSQTAQRDTSVARKTAPATTASEAAATGPVVIKTFRLAYMKGYEAQTVIAPYAPNGLSVNGALMTVRTSPDRMAQVEKVLAEYDRPPASVSLTFELVATDTTPTRDPAVAGLDSVLRGVLRFSGYKLVGRALGSANEGASFTGTLSDGLHAAFH